MPYKCEASLTEVIFVVIIKDVTNAGLHFANMACTLRHKATTTTTDYCQHLLDSEFILFNFSSTLLKHIYYNFKYAMCLFREWAFGYSWQLLALNRFWQQASGASLTNI